MASSGEAESLVKDALAQNPSQADRHRLTELLVTVAQEIEDWPNAENLRERHGPRISTE